MNIYRVELVASHESTDYIGYHQNYNAYDNDGKWCGGLGKDASCFRHKSQVEGSEQITVVFSKDVKAPTPYSACRKLEYWSKSNLPESWLMTESQGA